MKNCDQSLEINHNLNQPYVPDHPYRILIVGGSRSGKTSVLLNLIKDQRPDIDKIYYASQIHSKYKSFISGYKKVGIKKLKKSKSIH